MQTQCQLQLLELKSPGSSAEAGTHSQPCALSTGGYRHWTGLQTFCCFFCPVKHMDGQPVTTSEFFFHFFCSILAVFWSKYKFEIMPRYPSLFSSKQQLQLLLPGNFLLFKKLALVWIADTCFINVNI